MVEFVILNLSIRFDLIGRVERVKRSPANLKIINIIVNDMLNHRLRVLFVKGLQF